MLHKYVMFWGRLSLIKDIRNFGQGVCGGPSSQLLDVISLGTLIIVVHQRHQGVMAGKHNNAVIVVGVAQS